MNQSYISNIAVKLSGKMGDHNSCFVRCPIQTCHSILTVLVDFLTVFTVSDRLSWQFYDCKFVFPTFSSITTNHSPLCYK